MKWECWYSIWNFINSENKTLKSCKINRLQRQFTEPAMPVNVCLTEKPDSVYFSSCNADLATVLFIPHLCSIVSQFLKS